MNLEIKGSPWEFATLVLAGLGLLLVIVNSGLAIRNQSIQVDVSQRQQTITQGQEFARIRQALAQVLGNIALNKIDHDLSDLLTRHGIAVTPVPAAPAAAAAPQGK
jgi:hypothetical protein